MKTGSRKLNPVSIYLGITYGKRTFNWFRKVQKAVQIRRNDIRTTNVLINMFNRINRAIDAGASDEDIATLYKEEMIFIDIYQEEMLPKDS